MKTHFFYTTVSSALHINIASWCCSSVFICELESSWPFRNFVNSLKFKLLQS